MTASAYWSVAKTGLLLHCSGAIEVGVPRIVRLELEEAYHAALPGRTHATPASGQTAEGVRHTSTVPGLPPGTVTLLFTDIERPTHLLQHLRDRYARVRADGPQWPRAPCPEGSGREL